MYNYDIDGGSRWLIIEILNKIFDWIFKLLIVHFMWLVSANILIWKWHNMFAETAPVSDIKT